MFRQGVYLSGIGEQEYFHSQLSLLRNPILAGVFFRLGCIEQFGTEIARIMHSYHGAVVQPSFKVTSVSIAITLPVVAAEDGVTQNQQMVLAVLNKRGLAEPSADPRRNRFK